MGFRRFFIKKAPMPLRKWHLKAIVQKGISFLPFSQRVNFLFQKHVTRGVRLTDAFVEDRLAHGTKHLLFFKKHSNYALGRTLELGTGWYPLVPVAMFLAGAKEIFSVDIDPLANRERLAATLHFFIKMKNDGRLDRFVPGWLPERFAILEKTAQDPSLSFEKMLETLRLKLLIADARKLDFPDGHFDLIHSNNTFEHIYPQILDEILAEFARLGRPGGVQSHFVDLSDHFAHLDRGITIYNYLQFSERQWALIDNSVQPQNRLRWPDYLGFYKKNGLKIVEEETRPGNLSELRRVERAAVFQKYSEADAAISHGYLVSKG